jgi:hypothetical protein
VTRSWRYQLSLLYEVRPGERTPSEVDELEEAIARTEELKSLDEDAAAEGENERAALKAVRPIRTVIDS